MTAVSRKRILLGVLLIVLAYVWWDGFHKMYPDTAAYLTHAPVGNANPTRGAVSSELVYREPKTNPFFRPQQQPAGTQPRQGGNLPTGVPPLRVNNKLIGVLGRGKQSQAVMSTETQNVVVSLGDSVGAWELLMIGNNYAVFRHEKQRDTLWLYQTPQ